MATPFRPQSANTVNIDVAATSARIAIPGAPSSVRVMNNGTATAWIEFGGVTVAATLGSSMPVGPGVTEVISFLNPASLTTYVAAIAAGSTGKIYFTPGTGI